MSTGPGTSGYAWKTLGRAGGVWFLTDPQSQGSIYFICFEREDAPGPLMVPYMYGLSGDFSDDFVLPEEFSFSFDDHFFGRVLSGVS